MYNEAERQSILDSFAEAIEQKAGVRPVEVFPLSYLKAGNEDYVRGYIRDIFKMMEKSIPVDLGISKLTLRVAFDGPVTFITIKNKYEDSNIHLKIKIPVSVSNQDTDDTLYEKYVESIYDVFRPVLDDALMKANVKELNEALVEITEKANLDYQVRVVTPFENGGKTVAYISDSEVVFTCDEDRVFEIGKLRIMQKPSVAMSEEDIEAAKVACAEEFATAQTTAQFVGNQGFDLMRFVCDIGKQKKPSRFLKKVTGKNIMNGDKAVDGLYYYLKDNVFALVATKDGIAEVVFSPIDLETYQRVEDIDVVDAFKKN